jgi:hypothetical protein
MAVKRTLRPSVRVTGVLAIAVAIGFGAWLFVRHDNDSGTASTTSIPTNPNPASLGKPVAATQADLAAVAKRVRHVVYWAGRRAGNTYELTETHDGRIYIRYLTGGAKPGDKHGLYTTVGTYPDSKAYAKLQTGAKRSDARSFQTQSGAEVVTYASSPKSAYFAFKGLPYLVEVFDPSAKQALNLVLSGKIRLVQ